MRKVLVRGALVTLVATAAAVGSTALGASAPPKTPNGTTIGTRCGQVPPAETNDLSGGVLAKLPADVRATMYGFQTKIVKSAYSNWKPKGKPPYTVAVDYGPILNSWGAYHYNLLQRFLQRSAAVDKVIAVTRRSNQDPTEALQTYNSLIAQKPDIILVLESLTAVVTPAIEAAGKAGIPTISMTAAFENPYAVDIVPNGYFGSAETVARMLDQLGGNANVMYIHSFPGTSLDQRPFDAIRAAMRNCPGAKLVGEINGFFSPPATKGGMLQWLATHQEKVDLVTTSCCMATAALQAFLQAGRPVPGFTEVATLKSLLGYWNSNKGTFKAAVMAGGATGFADLVTRVTLRMLAGQGPKLNVVPWISALVTSANLGQYARPGWTIDTVGTVENPKSTWLTDKQLDSLFIKPNLKKGTGY